MELLAGLLFILVAIPAVAALIRAATSPVIWVLLLLGVVFLLNAAQHA